jgi:threonine dehydrogenase-like Zn-dependent dehydrogenase
VRVTPRAVNALATITKLTDAIIRTTATCVCGSDLWDYRGINPVPQPKPMGHEYCGIVVEVGSEVRSIRPGQFVIGSFFCFRQYVSQLPGRLSVILPEFLDCPHPPRVHVFTRHVHVFTCQ